jgi:anaerobic magnesium-protoporphyrin IX monomethyl ester cyclase
MDNVILFRPRERYSGKLATHKAPLGLICLGTALKSKGYSPKIIDCETSTDWQMELENAVDKDTIIAGVGVMTGYQIKGALDFSRAIKQIKPVPVVWGGLHPSLLPDQTIQHELVDIVVIGEGEDILVRLADKISKGDSLETIPNIIFKKNGDIIKTSYKKPFIDMDTLNKHDYDLIDTEYYASFDSGYYKDRLSRCLDINTDRGCPHRC